MKLKLAKTKSNERPTVTLFNADNLAYAIYRKASESSGSDDETIQIPPALELVFIGSEPLYLSGPPADELYAELKLELAHADKIYADGHIAGT